MARLGPCRHPRRSNSLWLLGRAPNHNTHQRHRRVGRPSPSASNLSSRRHGASVQARARARRRVVSIMHRLGFQECLFNRHVARAAGSDGRSTKRLPAMVSTTRAPRASCFLHIFGPLMGFWTASTVTCRFTHAVNSLPVANTMANATAPAVSAARTV